MNTVKYVRFVITALLLFQWGLVSAQGGVPWREWSQSAFDEAREEHRLILLDLSADWCAYCKEMDATTWKDPDVLAVITKDYLPIQIVDEKSPQLAARYRQYGRPAVVILDAEGRELIRKRGYMKPQWMKWMLQAVVQEHGEGKL